MSAILQSDLQSDFEQNYLSEIQSRASALLADHDPEAREEGVQEITSMAWAMYDSAMVREKTDLTPYTLASFAHRNYRRGRRFAGTSSTDALAPAAHQAGRCEVTSLSARVSGDEDLDLADVLADPRLDRLPPEQVRVKMDYPAILRRGRISRRARQVWRELLKDWGPGHVTRIARKLGVTPGRVCQAKTELAEALDAWGYRPRGGRALRREPDEAGSR